MQCSIPEMEVENIKKGRMGGVDGISGSIWLASYWT